MFAQCDWNFSIYLIPSFGNEFPKDGIKCIEKFQSHCANMTFADKSRYDRTIQQVTHKGG